MEKALVERYLEEGYSLERIGSLTGRDPSTVGYWIKKHGLKAVHRERCAPRGGIAKETLLPLIEEGMTLAAMAQALGVSVSTVRHWLEKYGLASMRGAKRREAQPARSNRAPYATLRCPHHGSTRFQLEGRGSYRCLKCRSEGVSRRRRKVKALLVAEAGGRCRLCGYDRHPAALHFHHLDRGSKDFGLSHGGLARSLAKAREEGRKCVLLWRKCVLLCSNCHAEVEAGAAALS